MALGTTGISTSLVASTIGVGSNDVGTLCAHLNVNKWSKWKPIVLNKIGGLIDADFKSVNYGFTIPTYSTPYEVLNAILLNTKWTYNKPIGGSTSPYRLGDFRNYDHFAQDWFIFNPTSSTNIEYTNNWSSYINEDIQWIINNFNEFSFIYNNGTPYVGALDLGMILRSTSSSSTAENCYYYKICDWIDMNTERPFNITLPANSIPIDNYYIIPVLTTSTNFSVGTITYIDKNSTVSGTWYLLPVNPLTINIYQSGHGIISNLYAELFTYDVTIDNMSYYATVNSIVVTVTNENTNSVNITLQYRMADAVSGNIGGVCYATIAGSSSLEVELIDRGQYPNGILYETVNNEPVVDLKLIYEQSSRQYNLQLF